MLPKLKNIIIFVSIGIVFSLIYIFFIKGDSESPDSLVSSAPAAQTAGTTTPAADGFSADTQLAQDFLALLLNIKTIKLNDIIFSDPAFQALHDSSIVLIPDGNEGRPNPFAPIGVDIGVLPSANPAPTTTPVTAPPATTTPNTPTQPAS